MPETDADAKNYRRGGRMKIDPQWRLDNIRPILARTKRISKQQLRKEAIAQSLADKGSPPDFPDPEPAPVKRLI